MNASRLRMRLGSTGEALYMAEKPVPSWLTAGYIQTYPICDPISGVIEIDRRCTL